MAVTARTGERLVRLCFEVEAIAARLREAGYEAEAMALSRVPNDIRWAGEKLLDKIAEKKR